MIGAISRAKVGCCEDCEAVVVAECDEEVAGAAIAWRDVESAGNNSSANRIRGRQRDLASKGTAESLSIGEEWSSDSSGEHQANREALPYFPE